MADPKTQYQVKMSDFYTKDLPSHPEWAGRFAEAQKKTAMHKTDWAKVSVNLNEVVEKFTGNAPGESHGLKCIYKGKRYYVIADYVGHYLRIMDTQTGKFVKIDGSPCLTQTDFNEAHYRIKTKEEM